MKYAAIGILTRAKRMRFARTLAEAFDDEREVSIQRPDGQWIRFGGAMRPKRTWWQFWRH
jgi:hypothetical protein